MPALETPLRRILEKKVIQARDTAEDAARTALDRLIGDTTHAPAYLNADEVTLRETVLAKERQLGSREALIRECAYEHWHAMLFARFLEASDLLMHPELGVAVTMDDLTELAEEEGDAGAYATAARYAAHMLPGIFRPTDPLLRVTFAPEARQTLERLLDEIPKPAYTADDALGWVYQFWQTEQKNRVNRSGRKIAGADISPVTQLFTEHYMVQFMLHNTIGAWWTARHPDQPLPTEKSYLRLNDDGTPAAGTFPGWPATVKELKVIDPSCGSGHFLVAAFALLRRLRVLEEGLSEQEAADAVLRDNLHGLELDPRCTQLAAFNLTLEAWKVGGYRPLPPLNVACSGLNISASVDDWLQFAPDNTARNVFRVLHEEFLNAPNLGSLINPREGISQRLGMFGEEALEKLPQLVGVLLEREVSLDPAAAIYGENVQGVARAANLMNSAYHLVITNPPYLGKNKQDNILENLISRRFKLSAGELSAAFIERNYQFLQDGGVQCIVTAQSFITLKNFEDLRSDIIKNRHINFIVKMGSNSFESDEAAGAVVAMFCSEKNLKNENLFYLDVSHLSTIAEKTLQLIECEISKFNQEIFRKNRMFTFLTNIEHKTLLDHYVYSAEGTSRGDTERFDRCFWELISIESSIWTPMIDSPATQELYSGREKVIMWENRRGELAKSPSARIRGTDAWGKKGIFISRIGKLRATIYTGEIFAQNGAAIIPKDPNDLAALWEICKSEEYKKSVLSQSDKLIIPSATLKNVSVSMDDARRKAHESCGSRISDPYSNDPTQWLFMGTVTDTTEPLHVAMARLLGYAWPDQVPDTITPDADGIVPLAALMGERAAHERLLDALAGEFGAAWTPAKLAELLAQVGADSLEGWLRDKFFEGHAKLFHHRPFLWHVWDGRKDGFSAVVNYHTLDRARLEKLTFTYLGAWIDRQRGSDEKGADLRLAAAVELQRKLEAILTGEPPYDIYVRWKALGEQPRGWNPDLNDGVRLNIRPFIEASVLRARVNVRWTKDRGNDPGKVDFQKVHGRDPETDLERHESTERHNDLHFTLEEKEAAAN